MCWHCYPVVIDIYYCKYIFGVDFQNACHSREGGNPEVLSVDIKELDTRFHGYDNNIGTLVDASGRDKRKVYMAKIEISNNIFWVGIVDWNLQSFHGHTYHTKRGSTYNSYLIMDDKITLVDGVLGSFSEDFINNIKEIVDPSKIDYIIANHVETDHSGAIPKILELCPKAKVFGTQKCKEGLYRYYYKEMDFQVVKTGDKLKLGKKTLQFIEAPMIHWPDSMFTYAIEDALLMCNDAFGQHYATSNRFDDEVDTCALMEESAAYYANILWPLSAVILRKIEEIQKMNIPIKIIAPSHGIIWRKDPSRIINQYLKWAKNETTKKVVIVYETMWGATEKMAKYILQGVKDSGAIVRFYDIARSDSTAVFTDMLDAKGFIIGSSTHDNEMLPTIAGFLHLFKGFKPKNRIAAAFGSFGWGGGATKSVEETLKQAGVEIIQPSLSARFYPDVNEVKNAYEFGKSFAGKL
jgi:anaerobic nitric oxide reductase flavorubredoxin